MPQLADLFTGIARTQWHTVETFKSILANDAKCERAFQVGIHRTALYDVLSNGCSDPMGCLAAARCEAFAERGISTLEGREARECSNDIMLLLLTHGWPKSRIPEIAKLVATYVRCGMVDINASVNGHANGTIVETDSPLEHAIRNFNVDRVAAFLAAGADPARVPAKETRMVDTVVAAGDVFGFIDSLRAFKPQAMASITAHLRENIMQRTIDTADQAPARARAAAADQAPAASPRKRHV